MYGQMQVTNYVDYTMSAYAPKPLFLDYTPPIAGTVFDGYGFGVETQYSNDNKVVSANWIGFTDPESGIMVYRKFSP